MKFRLPYDDRQPVYSCAGNTMKPQYTLVNRHGERSLKQVGEVDIVASINSYADQTNLRAMLRRYALTGDISVFGGTGKLVYEDVSECETDLARLIDRSREIALLQLQTAKTDKEVSVSAEAGSAAAGNEAGSAAAGNEAGSAAAGSEGGVINE